MKFKFDCLFFRGDKPCGYNRTCSNCRHYKKIKKRILIIKLAAIGDVLRTTVILRRLKEKYPNCHISWVVAKEGREILENNKLINRVLELKLATFMRLQVEKFDIAICLDKEPEATALIMLVNASKKFGFGMNAYGTLSGMSSRSDYNLRLGVDNKLKFKKNKKTYPQLIFEMLGWQYKGEEYVLNLTPEELSFGKNFVRQKKIKNSDIVIGLNTGCGDVFSTKKWTISGFITLARKLTMLKGMKVVLLGGNNETQRNKVIANKVKMAINSKFKTLREFISIVNCCDIVFSADTLAMHVAIALKKRVVALFGPTCAQEIELFGRGKKIISLAECAPCYKNKCLKHICMKRISAEMVFKTIKGQIRKCK